MVASVNLEKKQHRFSGKEELWFNEERNILVCRKTLISYEAMHLDPADKINKDPVTSFRSWHFHVFKPMGTFDFYDGTKWLQENGFIFMERI